MREALRLLGQWRSMRFAGYDVYGHPIVVERVGQNRKLTDKKDIEKEEIIKGRAVHARSQLQALKYAGLETPRPGRSQQNEGAETHLCRKDMRERQDTELEVLDRFRSIMQTMEITNPRSRGGRTSST